MIWTFLKDIHHGIGVDVFTLILFNVIVCYSKYSLPPRLSGQGFTIVFGVQIKPVEVVVRMAVGSALAVLVSSTRDPWGISWFLAVPTVVIQMTDIIPMFGTVMGNLIPFVSMLVFLHNLLVN